MPRRSAMGCAALLVAAMLAAGAPPDAYWQRVPDRAWEVSACGCSTGTSAEGVCRRIAYLLPQPQRAPVRSAPRWARNAQRPLFSIPLMLCDSTIPTAVATSSFPRIANAGRQLRAVRWQVLHQRGQRPRSRVLLR